MYYGSLRAKKLLGHLSRRKPETKSENPTNNRDLIIFIFLHPLRPVGIADSAGFCPYIGSIKILMPF